MTTTSIIETENTAPGIDPIEWVLERGREWQNKGDIGAADIAFRFVLLVDPTNKTLKSELEKQLNFNISQTPEAENFSPFPLHIQPSFFCTSVMASSGSRKSPGVEALITKFKLMKELHRTEPPVEPEQNQPVTLSNSTFKKIGELLTGAGYLTQEQLYSALNLQRMLARIENKEPIGQVLLDYGYITKGQLEEVLKLQKSEQVNLQT